MLNAVLALNELDTKVFNSPSSGEAPRIYDSHIPVPDAHLLFNGEFKRVGSNDLKIVGEDGQSFFIQDYFASETRAHLMSPEGATLSASVVEALAGPLAPGQHAQAGGQAASTQPIIGRVDALSGSATVVRNGVTVALNVGDTVRKGDVVQTSGGSSVAIVFSDGSTFSLNANARMVLDDFVYAAGGTGNSALISLVQGTFSFVAGQVAKTGDMRVETPVATMGIRGTAVLVEISANDGQTRFSVMVEPDGTTGAFNLYNKTTGALIGSVSNSQVGWVVTPAGPLQVVAQQVQKTPGELAQELGIVQQIFTIFDNNQQNPFVPTQDRGDAPDTNPQTAQGGGGSGTPPPDATNNPLADIINAISNNPSTPTSGATVPLPTDPLLPFNPDSPPPAVTVIVSANKPPVAIDDLDGTPDGGVVIDNDSDPEGSVIVVKSAQHIDPVEGTPVGPVVPVDADGEQIEGTYGTLTLKADGTYSFAPHGEAFETLSATDAVLETFQYTITDPFGGTATATLTINLTGVNDAPTTLAVTLAAIAGDREARVITSAELLANAFDIDGDDLTVSNLQITAGGGTLVDNGDGTWTYTPAANDDSDVSFSYTITDSGPNPANVTGTATLDITPVNDAPTTSPVTLAAIAEDSGARLITSAELLASASDIDGDSLTVSNLQITSGGGTLVDNEDGTWTYTPAANDDGDVSFSYTVTDGALTVNGTATLDITPVNDAPNTSSVTLAAIAEDSGARLITSAELLANASDIDGDALTVSNLQITLGGGSLVNNGNGTWTYTPSLNNDTAVSFSYTVTDGALTAPGTATLDVTPVNDAPTTLPVTLAPIAEDSGPRLITSAQLLASASDIDGDSLTVSNLQITAGSGSLVDNGDGTWTYIPAANDDSAVSFSYAITDNAANPKSVTGTASLDITPVNDAPTTSPVTLAAIAEDSGARVITSAELLTNASDIDGDNLTVSNLQIASGNGALVNNGNGTWSYTPALNDDTAVSFSYTVTDNATNPASVTGTATLDITPVNDGPVAVNDTAAMTENQVLFVDVLANDAVGATNKSLLSVGTAIITGPEGVLLGQPAIVIENGQIRITPGTAFDALGVDALGVGEIATIVVPYTMQANGTTLTATATITVTGTNDAPYFSMLPEGYQSIGAVTANSSFGGVPALAMNTSGVTASAIEDFLETESGTLAAISAQNAPNGAQVTPTEGAAIAFDLALAANETITFSWNFASIEYLPYNDFAFFSFAPTFGDKLADIAMIGDYAADSFLHSSGWLEYSFTASAAGSYRLGIGVLDTGDQLVDLQLYISGFSGLGFQRTVDEDAGEQAFNLLFGASDPDATDVLSPTNITVSYTYQNADFVEITGFYEINGGSLVIDTSYFGHLNHGQSVTIVATYGVSDGTATVQNSATLVINGIGDTPAANDTPVANAVSASGDEDAYSIAVTLSGSDVDGTVSHFKLNSLPLQGDLSLDGFSTILDEDDLQQLTISAYEGTGTIYFRPHQDWNGQTTFDYVAVDNDNATSAPATATIDVAAVNDAPVANAVSASGDEDAYNIEITLTGSDIDGTVSHFKLNSLPLHGDLSTDGFSTILDEEDLQQLTISAYEGTRTIAFRPHDDWNGQTSFDYVAVDNDNAVGTAGTATITVEPVNDAPQVIGFNPNRSAGDSSVAGMALGHVLADDPDGDSLTYSLAPESSSQFTINEFTGALSAAGTASFGVYSIGVIVTDKDDLASDPREITVAIGHNSINGYQDYSSRESDVISYGLGGNDTILGGYGNDALIGGNGHDTLRGNYGDDVLIGGAGADWLSGGGGRDIIEGGSGNDTIRGGEGDDELTGGSGSDRFYFEPGEGQDVIFDMTLGGSWNADTIRLHDFGYEDVSNLVLCESDQGFLRIDLGEGQWIDLNGVSPITSLSNLNFIFSNDPVA